MTYQQQTGAGGGGGMNAGGPVGGGGGGAPDHHGPQGAEYTLQGAQLCHVIYPNATATAAVHVHCTQHPCHKSLTLGSI